MTNADKIRSMTNDELANFLADIQANEGFEVKGYCKGACPLKEECEKACECLNWNNNDDIKWWLECEHIM